MPTRTEKTLLAIAVASAAAAAMASETLNYAYDARGRLVKVQHNGSVNGNVTTNYGYDKADNRILKNTSGVP
jgi:YD repeat-containing protein